MFFPRIISFVSCIIALSFLAHAKPLTIAVTQITSHASLDKVRQGLLADLKEHGIVDGGIVEGDPVKIIFENAQGNIATAGQIAQKFASLSPSVMVGISTPSAQLLLNAVRDAPRPVVFATVSDPLSAKLVDNLAKPGGYVTGTQNLYPAQEQARVIHRLFPEVRTVGVIVNLSEANTVAMLNMVKAALQTYGIQLVETAVTQATQVKSAAEALAPKIDLLLFLQDNTVASAISSVTETMKYQRIPTLAGFPEAIENGALLAIAYDEEAIGRDTGKIVRAILQGANPGDLPVKQPEKLLTRINPDTLKLFPELAAQNVEAALLEATTQRSETGVSVP